jgi:hypothetical protein
LRRRVLVRMGDAGKKFSGTRGVSSCNRLIRIHVTYGTILVEICSRSGLFVPSTGAAWGKPDVLATADFREFLFHALR